MDSVGRVFAAVPLPDDVRHALADKVAAWRLPGKVVPPQNWHLTVRFLGSVDVVTYERFLHGLENVGSLPTFRITLEGVGAFPNPEKATVVWAGVGMGLDGLAALNAVAEEAATAASLELEERPYRPHLTLARVRPPQDIGRLAGEVVGLAWVCDRVVVFRSQTGRGGARYDPLESFTLSG